MFVCTPPCGGGNGPSCRTRMCARTRLRRAAASWRNRVYANSRPSNAFHHEPSHRARPSRMLAKKSSSCSAYPLSAQNFERVRRIDPLSVSFLKSSVVAPTPGPNASTRSPPDVRLPTVQYVRFATEPSANRNEAAMLFSPIGSCLPTGRQYAETLPSPIRQANTAGRRSGRPRQELRRRSRDRPSNTRRRCPAS